MVLISEAPVTEVPGRVRPRRSVASGAAAGVAVLAVPRVRGAGPAAAGRVGGRGGGAGWGGRWRFRHFGPRGGLGFIAAGGNAATNFLLFGGSRHVGGYVFLHRDRA